LNRRYRSAQSAAGDFSGPAIPEQPVEDITTVYSHPQALAQCYDWISKNLSHAETKEVFSTAMAAKMAHDEPCAAAVASEFAAKIYGVPVLSAD